MKKAVFITINILVIITSLFFIIKSDNNYKLIKTSITTKMISTKKLSNIIKKNNEDISIEEETNKKQEEKTEIEEAPQENKIEEDPKQNKTPTVIQEEIKENIQPVEEQKEVTINNNPEEVYVGLKFTGSMTAYGKDCCGSDISKQGITATGHDLKQSLTYNDPTYGNLRIVASDKNFKYYSVIKVNDPIEGVYNVIVLDRAGSSIGLTKTKKFDLAVESEEFAAIKYGVHNNVTFEVLRIGR